MAKNRKSAGSKTKGIKRRSPVKRAATKKKPTTKRSVAKDKPDPRTVFGHLELKHVRLLDLKTNLDIKKNKLPTAGKFEVAVHIGTSADNSSIHINAHAQILGRADESEDEDESSKFTMEMVYQCVLTAKREVTGDILEDHVDWLANTGLKVVWPYVRETMASTMTRMGIPPYTLPLFVVGTANELEKTSPND